MNVRNRLLVGADLGVAFSFAGCNQKPDTITQAERTAGGIGPGIAETKPIAQEAYSYALPTVAAYKALYQSPLPFFRRALEPGRHHQWRRTK